MPLVLPFYMCYSYINLNNKAEFMSTVNEYQITGTGTNTNLVTVKSPIELYDFISFITFKMELLTDNHHIALSPEFLKGTIEHFLLKDLDFSELPIGKGLFVINVIEERNKRCGNWHYEHIQSVSSPIFHFSNQEILAFYKKWQDNKS